MTARKGLPNRKKGSEPPDARPIHATRIPVPAGARSGLAAVVQLRLPAAILPTGIRVASIAAMQRSLKPQSTGQHRGNPPFLHPW